MNTIEHLHQLFSYNDWANRRIVVAVRDSGNEECLKILSHLLTAEREWYERLYGKEISGTELWPVHNAEECGIFARENAQNYEKLLRRFDEEGLDIRCRYVNSTGIPYENTFREVLSHVLMHSAIHRGNIIFQLREKGFVPPQTDLIIYLRETKYI